jgi:hypothetical protein
VPEYLNIWKDSDFIVVLKSSRGIENTSKFFAGFMLQNS